MINKETIFALLHKMRPKDGVRTYVKQTIYPRRDWLIGILGFTLIVLSGSAYTFYTFNTYKNLHSAVQGTAKPVESLKENTIDAVLVKYQKRRDAFVDALGTDVTLTTPVATSTPAEEAKPVTDEFGEVGIADSASSSEALQEAVDTTTSATLSAPILE